MPSIRQCWASAGFWPPDALAGPRVSRWLVPAISAVAARWRGSRRPAGRRGAGTLVEDGPMIGDRWGVSESETVRSYPCDDFVAAPTLRAWRGVRVEAPA